MGAHFAAPPRPTWRVLAWPGEKISCRQPQFKLIHHQRRKIDKSGCLLLADQSRESIDHVDSSEPVAIVGYQRRSCVKTKPQLSGDQRVRQRTGIDSGVCYHVAVILQDCRCAQPREPIDLVDIQAVTGLEPDPILVNYGNRRYRSPEKACGKPCYPVECSVTGSI